MPKFPVFLATAALCVVSQTAFASPRKTVSHYVEGEVLVHYKNQVAPLARTFVPMQIAAREIQEIPKLGWHHLKLPAGVSTADAIKQLSQNPQVDFVEPNYIRRASQFVPTDPDYPLQYGPRLIGCEQAWNQSLGSNSVTIAFVDTGIDIPNTEFAGRIKIIAGENLINPGSNPVDDDQVDDYHGTHVAGIAAAALDNNYGIAGVCPNALIMPVKALDNTGNGTIANLAKGYMFAADNGADIINASLGGSDFSQTEKDAVTYAISKGKFFVAAAGNTGDQGNALFYPAAYPGVIGVGAVDQSGNYVSWSQFGSWVKVAAPGNHIFSTAAAGAFSYDDGTSFSAPHVAGALGLLKAYAGPTATNQQILNALYSGCVSVGTFCQYGLINVENSIQLLTSSGTTTTVAPYGANSYIGTINSGTVNSLAVIDGIDLVIGARVLSNSTQAAGFKASYLVTVPQAQITKIGLSIASSGNLGGTINVYFYNFLRGRYESIGTSTLGTTQSSVTVSTSSFSRYLRAGEIRALVVSTQPSGPPASFVVDQAVISVTTSSGG